MDGDADGVISLDEFIVYYNSYEDYLLDAFSAWVTDLLSSTSVVSAEWYYLNDDGDSEGPCDVAWLKQMFGKGLLLPESQVWCADLEEWKCVQQLDELMACLKG